MIVAVPVQADGSVDPRWGRAQRVAVAEVDGDDIVSWDEHHVGWGELHDAGPEGSHHARIARFLREHAIELVVAHHVGEGMRRMLGQMDLRLALGAAGDARAAAVTAADVAHDG